MDVMIKELTDNYDEVKVLDVKGVDFASMKIESLRYGISPFLVGCCGPLPQDVLGEAVLLDEKTGERYCFTLADVDGFPNFYITNISIMKKLLNIMKEEDDALVDIANDCCFPEMENYYVAWKKRESNWFLPFSLVSYVVDSSERKTKAFIKKAVGKTLGDVKIPLSDPLKEAKEEMEEEE